VGTRANAGSRSKPAAGRLVYGIPGTAEVMLSSDEKEGTACKTCQVEHQHGSTAIQLVVRI